MVKEKG